MILVYAFSYYVIFAISNLFCNILHNDLCFLPSNDLHRLYLKTVKFSSMVLLGIFILLEKKEKKKTRRLTTGHSNCNLYVLLTSHHPEMWLFQNQFSLPCFVLSLQIIPEMLHYKGIRGFIFLNQSPKFLWVI